MRRSKIDTIIDVLDVAKMRVNKTSIAYRTNLNFTLADKYLDILQKLGLVENRSDKYITTYLLSARVVERLRNRLQSDLIPVRIRTLAYPFENRSCIE